MSSDIFSFLFNYKQKSDFLFAICSPECKSVIDDGLSDVAASLLAAFDGGELLGALEEGQTGWQKWVKSFGKSLKRKVRFTNVFLTRNYRFLVSFVSQKVLSQYICAMPGEISFYASPCVANWEAPWT